MQTCIFKHFSALLLYQHKFQLYFIGFVMKKSVFNALASVAIAVLAIGFSLHTASAQEPASHQLPAAGGWGFGPMMASLVFTARQEAPIRGVDPSPEPGVPVRTVILEPPVKVEAPLPTMVSVEALEQSIATAASTDFAAKASRQIALAKD
jgi:hypothetical protein